MLAIQRQPTDGNKFVENGMRGILRVPRANVIIKRIIQRMWRGEGEGGGRSANIILIRNSTECERCEWG